MNKYKFFDYLHALLKEYWTIIVFHKGRDKDLKDKLIKNYNSIQKLFSEYAFKKDLPEDNST